MTGDFVYCQPPPPTHQCLNGQLKCVDNYAYQVCATDQYGNTFWKDAVHCTNGMKCNPDPTCKNIFCVPESYLNNSVQCASGDMRCVTNNTYQMCLTNSGGSIWNTVQKCPENQVCSNQGNVAYCAPKVDSANCVYRNMRCKSDNSYQTCNKNPQGITYWDTELSCRPGQTCHQILGYSYCY